ncbi:MAG: methyltransferase family protein [Myxococcota bacterium]
MRLTALLRHLAAITALPVTVTLVVPLWLAHSQEVSWSSFGGVGGLARTAGAGVLLSLGLALFAASLHGFATRGEGTLAPWDPPLRLVVDGPYRFVRNPMISGVCFVLLGEAVLLGSWVHGLWAVFFILLNAIYIPLVEEPQLERRFGEAYREYRGHVPRLVPRLRPWSPPSGAATREEGPERAGSG